MVRGRPRTKRARNYDTSDEQTDHHLAKEPQDRKSLLYFPVVASIFRMDGWMVLILLRSKVQVSVRSRWDDPTF
ncbi:MAG: hypothetical protein DMG52_04845 [Acidobacteria bacterium]|nr:MAG: hypothetical protein DMG52_04845 [Acidobacteriota bacterium]